MFFGESRMIEGLGGCPRWPLWCPWQGWRLGSAGGSAAWGWPLGMASPPTDGQKQNTP